MRVRAIINPRAGVARAAARAAVERGRPGWADYGVRLTEAPGHALELAREAAAEGADCVLAVGGDGTVNEVARGLLGSETALGIVPVGSGNGLARALRIPLRAGRALAALEDATPRRMDIGLLNGHPFLNVAGVGFDAAVGVTFHERGQRGERRGILGYVRHSVRELASYQPPRVDLTLDGHPPREIRPFVLTFANGPQYGSGAVINAAGKLDDGQLEVVLFEPQRLGRTLLAAMRMFLRCLDGASGYSCLPARRVSVRAATPLPIHVDGDPLPASDRVEVAIQAAALTVLVPRRAGRYRGSAFS